MDHSNIDLTYRVELAHILNGTADNTKTKKKRNPQRIRYLV